MKKSKAITLVLITAMLASCHKSKKEKDWNSNEVYMRSDESANYSSVNNLLLWYLAFRPYGSYYGGSYHHAGYYSSAIPEAANIGHSSFKSGVVRGGFGSGGHSFSVSS